MSGGRESSEDRVEIFGEPEEIICSSDLNIKQEVEDSEDTNSFSGAHFLTLSPKNEPETNSGGPSSQIHTCRLCQAEFHDEYLFLSHKRGHRKEKLCPICNKIYTHNSHLRIHSGEKPYACSACPMRFTMNQNLQRHYLRVHSEARPFKCPQCPKNFPLREQLKSHLRIHTGERPYICPLCPRRFGDRSYFSRHLKGHSAPQEKIYLCPICPKKFNSYSNLYGHKRTHSEEKRFVCGVCRRGFNRNSHLKSHLRTHEVSTDLQDKKYSCAGCSRWFLTERSLRKHQKKQHSVKKLFSCAECHQYFLTELYLNEHRVSHLISANDS